MPGGVPQGIGLGDGAAPRLGEDGRVPSEKGQSAVVVPVPAAEPLVSTWRQRFDSSAAQGMPAHITALYPFLPDERLTDGVLAMLGELCAQSPVLDVQFRHTARFPGVLYLDPEPADGLPAPLPRTALLTITFSMTAHGLARCVKFGTTTSSAAPTTVAPFVATHRCRDRSLMILPNTCREALASAGMRAGSPSASSPYNPSRSSRSCSSAERTTNECIARASQGRMPAHAEIQLTNDGTC
jgi:hypothetical protein